jgi:hypothetical protein
MSRWPDAVIGIPVKNEAGLIGDCLQAVDTASRGLRVAVLLLLNNCADGTAHAVRALSLACAVHIVEHDFPPALAGAGRARRLAMQHAARLAGPDTALMTTDADGRVAPDWIAANLRALAAGADAVCGRIEIDPVEALVIPPALHDDDAQECEYDRLLDEIAWLLDPDPYDPWSRHTQESGATLAVTKAAFERCGGIPDMASGEDRGFVAALRRIDARVRHAPEPLVIVSARLWGRAPGGMAETIRRRMRSPDPFIDDRLEPATDAARRATLRNGLRRHHGRLPAPPLAALATALDLPVQAIAAALGEPAFGAAWNTIEAASPVLVRRLVATADLARQTVLARGIRNRLVAGLSGLLSEDPADSWDHAAATAD